MFDGNNFLLVGDLSGRVIPRRCCRPGFGDQFASTVSVRRDPYLNAYDWRSQPESHERRPTVVDVMIMPPDVGSRLTVTA